MPRKDACPKCWSGNIGPSRSAVAGDMIYQFFGRRPFHCRSCRTRFYRAIKTSRWSAPFESPHLIIGETLSRLILSGLIDQDGPPIALHMSVATDPAELPLKITRSLLTAEVTDEKE